ncbi:MAG: 1-acyl-sn-glycerol-3-phosphate acyltransferase [Victivallaceae bacterium]|nr:1-acyl-sn-glycerol-3-phosphate acyltransferase [Victivallaceae bacterium]
MSEAYLFNGMDSYDTPADVETTFWSRLFGGTRLYFYSGCFRTFVLAGKDAQKGKLSKEQQIRHSSENIKLIERIGGKLHLRGLDKLRANAGKPMVIAGNHMSLLETALVHAILREYVDFSFVIKASLLKTPYMKDILSSFESIPVTRQNPREDLKTVLGRGKEILRSGRALIIFPQSTRSETFDPESCGTLAVKLAKSAGVPMMPMALKTDLISNGRGKLKDLGPIHPEKEVWFEFGDPMDITGNGREQHQAFCDFVSTRLVEWRRMETK